MTSREQEVLEMREKGRMAAHRSIYDSYTYAGEHLLRFRMEEIFEGQAAVMLPDLFLDMPKIYAEEKYPSVNRPMVIKTSGDTAVNFCFNFYKEQVKEQDIPYVSRIFETALRKLYPSHEFKGRKTEYLTEKGDRVMSWFDYISPTLTEPVYNLQGFLCIDGRLFQAIFNAPSGESGEWKGPALEVFASVRGRSKNLQEGVKGHEGRTNQSGTI